MIKDNVKCCNCGFDGLVGFGADECPECSTTGTLAWKDDEPQELYIDESVLL